MLKLNSLLYICGMKKTLLICFLVTSIAASLSASIPAGYYKSLGGKQTASLKTELHKIIMRDTTRFFAYGAGVSCTWHGFYLLDRDTITQAVMDMYSDEKFYFSVDYVAQKYPSFGRKIHIEHCMPKSWWGSHQWAAYKDLNHLYPSEGTINISKGNNPLGVVMGKPTKHNGVSKSGPANYEGYVGNVFEPADEFKGDFARTYFYMATAYQHYEHHWDATKPQNMMENNSYPVLKPWAIELLLSWSRQDPVSDKERTRNNKVFIIQGNRNPFIDFPELPEYIWGNKKEYSWSLESTTVRINKTRAARRRR